MPSSWQRGGYDRNVTDPATLRTMIDYIHQNPVRRGLVQRATDWPWPSARFCEGALDVPIRMDPLPVMDAWAALGTLVGVGCVP
jgi:hypothetical protein